MPLVGVEPFALEIRQQMNKISCNILCNKSRYETVNGRDFLVLEAMAVKGDTAMNRKFYPFAVVAKKSSQLEGKPAPLSHPKFGSEHVTADNFFTKGAHDIGAQVMHSSMSGMNNIAEIWVDVEVAGRTDRGKRLLDRAEKKQPIGVSTGLIPTTVSEVKGIDSLGHEYDEVVEDFEYDHLALLLDEQAAGAAAGTEVIYNSEQKALVVNHGGQPSQHEENSMKHEFDIADLSKAERVQFQALTVNEIMEAVNRKPEAVTLDTAKDVVTNAGLLVNSKDEGEFISKEDAKILANAKKAEAERIEEMQDFIVTNSEMTKDMIANMDESALLGLYNTIEKSSKPDYSMNKTVITNAKDGADAGEFNAIDY